jgi:hypothetical protein
MNEMLLRTTGKIDCYRLGIDRIAEDRVSKFVGPTAEIEFEKACAIERALAGSPYSTPKPLRFDMSAGRVEFKFIPDTVRLLEIMERAYRERDLAQILELNRSSAEMLALLHRNLKLEFAVRWTPPDSLVQAARRHGRDLNSLDEIYKHCDFSPVNILVTPSAELVLIDASPNYYFTHRADLVGPRYIAIATYTSKLFWPFRIKSYALSRRAMAHVLRTEFITRYEQASGVSIDREMLCLFERAVVRSFIFWKTQVVPVRWIAMAMSRVALPSMNA